jgi:hypothetical protein
VGRPVTKLNANDQNIRSLVVDLLSRHRFQNSKGPIKQCNAQSWIGVRAPRMECKRFVVAGGSAFQSSYLAEQLRKTDWCGEALFPRGREHDLWQKGAVVVGGRVRVE